MKKYFMTLAAVLSCTMTMTVFTACTNDNIDNPMSQSEPEKELAEYTIMYYGHGGGNREYYYLSKIGDFYHAGEEAYKHANVVVQYKFSTAENMKAQGGYDDNACQEFGGKTSRWVVDPSKSFQEQVYSRSSIYGDDNADHTCADSLTNFINWAAKACPAKKYMLIVHDHGGGYTPADDLPESAGANTRGLVYDDGRDNKHFTVKSFTRAIRQADVHIETLFMDACLMNCLEYQFELQDICDYVIAPTYSKPSIDGAYRMLPKLLGQPSVNIEQALDDYCKACVASWDEAWNIDETTPLYTDMTVTRTSGIAHLGEMLREFTDRLCDTYQNGTDAQRQAIDNCTASAIKVQLNQPNYDAIKYVKSIVNALPEVYGEEFYNQMKEAFNNCIVAQYFSKYLTAHNYMVDYSVLLGFQGAYAYTLWRNDDVNNSQKPIAEIIYAEDGKTYIFKVSPTDNPEYYESTFFAEDNPWGSTLADTYEQLAFDKTVGWSRWLRLNNQHPNLFCPKDLYFELPWPVENNEGE
jgi:hypothetical protein